MIVWKIYLLSNIAMLSIFVKFRGCTWSFFMVTYLPVIESGSKTMNKIWRSKKADPCDRKGSHETSLVQQQIQDTLRRKKNHPTKKNGQHLLPKTQEILLMAKNPEFTQLILVICTGFLLVGVVARWPGARDRSLEHNPLRCLSDVRPLAAPKMYQKSPRNVTKTPACIGDNPRVTNIFHPTSNSLTMSGQGWLLGRSKCHRLRPSLPQSCEVQ